MRAGRDRFGEIAGIFDAAVGDHGRTGFARGLDRIHDRGELRHADAGHDPRGADRARPDAHLDGIRAGIDQRLGALGGRDIAGNHLHFIRQSLHPADRIEHMLRMAVRGVDHHQIDAGLDQPLRALVALVANGCRSGHAQTSLLVLAGIRIGDRFFHVLHGDQADAAIIGIDHQQFLDPVLVQEFLRLGLTDAFAHGDQPILGHQLGDLLPGVGRKAHVAVGENADEFSGRAVMRALHHRHAGDGVFLHQRERVGERGLRIDSERIDHHAAFEFLDLAHLRRLLVGLEIAVDDAEAAGLRHGDRHRGLGHGVHGRGHNGNIERNLARHAGADIGVRRQDVGQAGLQQHVVEGETLARDAVHSRGCGLCHCQLYLSVPVFSSFSRESRLASVVSTRLLRCHGWRGPFSSSCPALSRASTSFLFQQPRRGWPGQARP